MKRRIIINIQDDSISDGRAVALVSNVIEMGRISETAKRKHYCHVSVGRDGLRIQAQKRTEITDTFSIWEPEKVIE